MSGSNWGNRDFGRALGAATLEVFRAGWWQASGSPYIASQDLLYPRRLRGRRDQLFEGVGMPAVCTSHEVHGLSLYAFFLALGMTLLDEHGLTT